MSNPPTILTVKLPYPLRHLSGEIKARGGRFNSDTKTWSLPDNAESRLLADQMAVPPPQTTVSPEERVRNVAATATELLNALKLGHFTLCQATADRVVIEQITTA